MYVSRFPQVSGIQFGFNPNGKPGHRVIAKTVKVQGKSLDRDRKYAVAMKEFLTKVGYSLQLHISTLSHSYWNSVVHFPYIINNK